MLAFSARGAFAVGLLAVTVLSLAPAQTLPTLNLSDKINHAIAYAFLAATGCFGFGVSGPRTQLLIIASLSVFGGVIEVLQPLSGRSASFADALANQVGIGLGWLLAWAAASLLRDPRQRLSADAPGPETAVAPPLPARPPSRSRSRRP